MPGRSALPPAASLGGVLDVHAELLEASADGIGQLELLGLAALLSRFDQQIADWGDIRLGPGLPTPAGERPGTPEAARARVR